MFYMPGVSRLHMNRSEWRDIEGGVTDRWTLDNWYYCDSNYCKVFMNKIYIFGIFLIT